MRKLFPVLNLFLVTTALAQSPPTILYGTTGNDILLLQGTVQPVSLTLTNEYSGETIAIDGFYNVSSYAYDGLAGTDTFACTNTNDLPRLKVNGYQMFYNIERFIGGGGDDIVDMSSTSIVLSNVFMDGGPGNDILWGNWGSDTIRAGDGNDNIDGGPGNDVLDGQNGDDIVSGGESNDTITPGLGVDALFGNDGDDTFIFTADTNLNGLNMSLDTFDGGPDYDTIYLTSGSDYLSLRDTNSTQVLFDIERFFLGSGNDVLDLLDTSIVLSNLTIYGEDGNDLITANAGDDYIDGGNGNDIIFGGNGNDIIFGGAGNDILDGGSGNDTIRGGTGGDQAWSGDGDDTFFASFPESAIDELDGGDGADTINVSEILTGFNPATSDPDLFVRLVPLTVGEFEFEVRVNTDGDVGGAFSTVARIRSIEFIDLGGGSRIVIPRIPEIVVEQPVSTNIANGGTNSFGTVAAGSNTNLTFTIRNLGAGELNLTGTPKVQMSGANAADFTVTLQPMTPVAFNHTTAFEVLFAPGATGLRTALITIANNDTNENPFEITLTGTGVGVTPSITAQPQSRTNLVGTLADFTVTASGTSPFFYQWWKDTAPLSGETNDTYSIASVSTNDAADYFVVVTNTSGSITSAVATLTVWVPPTITSDPASSTNLAGSTMMFTATAEGMEPLAYRWLKDGGPLANGGNVSGADTTTLTLTNLTLSDAAGYSLRVTNVAGSITSQVAVLTVVAPPEITSQPQSATNFVGTMVLLSVTAAGTEPLRYHWWKDSAPLSGETNNSFSITSADLTNSGDYVVVVTNDYGSVTSEVATLTVVVSNSPGIDIVWTNTANGSWHDAANWSPNVVPRPQDSATIGLAVTVSVNSSASVSNLTFSSATLSGSSVLSIGGVMAWESGKLSGKLVIAPEGVLNVTNNTIVFLDGCNLTNYGTATWTGADHLYAGNSAAIHNAGLWDIQTDSDIIYWSGVLPSFRNTGTLRKTGGSGDTSINIGFNTTGQVDVQQGTLSIYAWSGDSTLHGTLSGSAGMSPGPSLTVTSNAIWNWSGGTVSGMIAIASNGVCNWLGGTLGGNLDLAPGGTLNLTNSTIVFMNGGALTNRGAVLWTGDLFYVGNSAAIHNAGLWDIQTDSDIIYWSGVLPSFRNTGTLRKTGGSGDTSINIGFNTIGQVDVQEGTLSLYAWLGDSTLYGTLTGSAGMSPGPSLTVTSNAIWNWSGGTVSGMIAIASNGVCNWLGGTLGGNLDVAPGGTLNLTNSAVVFMDSGTLTNRGAVLWTGDHLYAGSAAIHNEGLWEIQTDSDIVYWTGAIPSFSNTGTLEKNAGIATTTMGLNFQNSGLLHVSIGTLKTDYIFVQSAGLTLLTGGNLQVTQPYQLLGGVLSGTNSITGTVVNDGGTVSPGESPGKLTINGSYTQTSNGVLHIELGGYSPGESFDQLEVTSTAILDGTLNITLTNGFIPTNNAVFTFVTAAECAGSFATFLYPSNAFGMDVGYTGISAFVQITNVASVVPTVVSGPFLDSGDIVVRFSGQPGEGYTIEWTPGLSPANWQKAVNLTAPTTDEGLGIGVFEFREALLPTGQRYYRAAYPAY